MSAGYAEIPFKASVSSFRAAFRTKFWKGLAGPVGALATIRRLSEMGPVLALKLSHGRTGVSCLLSPREPTVLDVPFEVDTPREDFGLDRID